MERAALLYDETCPFCRWSAEMILAWDRRGRLRPVALGDPEADELLASLDPAERRASWHLVLPDGTVHSAGEAVRYLAELLPGAAPIGRLAAALPGPTERAYRFVSEHRDTLARLLGRRAERADPKRGRRAPTKG